VPRGSTAVASGPSGGATGNSRNPNEHSAAGGTRASQSRTSGGGLGGSTGGAATASQKPRESRLAVVVRKRPMNRSEINSNQSDVVLCRNNGVIVQERKLKVDLTRYVEEHNFLFDHSFDENVTNEMLYSYCVRSLIDAIFTKAKCTCFAYGQTGSGKTYTMIGPPKAQREVDRTPGIFLLAASDIFQKLTMKEHNHLGVYIAFYEIYCGKLFDLLNNRQILHARENAKSNVIIVGLQEHPVENVQELMEVIEYGLNSRTVGVTGANVDSSRSHAILQISLKDLRVKEGTEHKEWGKISFIDLAGSERGADTMDIDRQTRMDGAEINKSLLALKECIRALDQQLDHTPFRGSKLTQVLKDSFIGGNCRTVMIANVSPHSASVEHTLNTLRYAYRVKELRRGNGESGGSAVSRMELGGNNQAQDGAPANEEDEMSETSRSDEELAGVQQQLHGGHTQNPPERVVGIGGADQGRRFDPAPRGQQQQPPQQQQLQQQQQQQQQQQLQPEEVPRYVAGAVANARHPEAVVLADGVEARADMHSVQTQELAPEVALEPVGCSQAALDELARQHDRLIGTILAEEEELITAHRQHIDMMVELIKEEMVHLNSVDRPGSDVDAYVAGIDRILRLKAQYIGDIRGRVDLFKEHLSQEDTLSRKFQTLASQPS